MVGAAQTPSRARSDTVIATRLGIVLRAILGFIIGIEVFFRGFRALAANGSLRAHHLHYARSGDRTSGSMRKNGWALHLDLSPAAPAGSNLQSKIKHQFPLSARFSLVRNTRNSLVVIGLSCSRVSF